MLLSECLELTSEGLCVGDVTRTCSALANVMPLSVGRRRKTLILLFLSLLGCGNIDPPLLISLCIVGLDVGSIDALGRPMIPLEKTEKKGLAHGIVAEITLTWQANRDRT